MITLPPPAAHTRAAYQHRLTCSSAPCLFVDSFSRMGLDLWRAKTVRATLVAVASLVDSTASGRPWGVFLLGRPHRAQWVAGGGPWVSFPESETIDLTSSEFFRALVRVEEATLFELGSRPEYHGELETHLGKRPEFAEVYPIRTESSRQGFIVVLETDGRTPDQGVPFQTLQAIAGLAAIALARLAMDKRLKALALEDPLTRLGNRRVFDLLLEKEIQRTKRVGSAFSLILFDLDRFKKINDTYGHKMGDAVLVAFGGLLSSVCRKGDTAARIGGDEFVLLLPGASAAHAAFVVRRLYRLAEKTPFVIEPRQSTFEITFSVGIRCVDQEHPEEVFNEADRRLYIAKQARAVGEEEDILGQWAEERDARWVPPAGDSSP